MTVTINIGGDTRSSDDKYCARIRRNLIENGFLVPTRDRLTPGERPTMSKEVVQKYRLTLIKQGLLTARTYESSGPRLRVTIR